jgi:EAL domain-containing protein (putative c-di-GMP-specific phosphodiesterase class I)/CheY-like chemotaxis protein
VWDVWGGKPALEKETAVKPVRFGQRKIVPRACVADSKKHVRSFLCEALQELGFTTCECAHPAEATGVINADIPDLLLLGFAGEGMEAVRVLQRLADERFGGRVLLFGARHSHALLALANLGAQLGLPMLPVLATPFGEVELRASLADFVPLPAPPRPPVDAAEALHNGWLELWYQPKINTRSLSVGGAEGLVRIRHPHWGMVSPSYFKPDDRDPHYAALSEFLINQAVADWHCFVSEVGPIELAINLPLSFLTSDGALTTIERLLPRHPAFPGLIVEIDGTELLRDFKLARDAAQWLKFHNIGLSVDGLGADWPSLLGQEEWPFFELKVDRKFIDGCAGDGLKRAACRRILKLSEGRTRTVAEGAETRADFLAVRELGFEMAQGCYLGKPMERRKFARHLALARFATG